MRGALIPLSASVVAGCVFANGDAYQPGRYGSIEVHGHPIARGGRTPRPFKSLVHTISFVSLDPTNPGYLVLAENNGPAAVAVGEGIATPGAYSERGDHERELRTRAREFLPIGMDPFQIDRTAFDLRRMERR